MARIKICPGCKHHNASNAMQCSECGRDIGSVKAKNPPVETPDVPLDEPVSDTTMELAAAEPTAAGSTVAMNEELKEYIVCEECGHHNLTSIRLCERCGESLVGIPITREDAGPAMVCSSSARLVTTDGLFQMELTKGAIILGREAAGADYFGQKAYVGRKHARLTYIDDGVYLEDLNSTNGTFVNGTKIPAGQPWKLCSSNVVGLGGNKEIQTSAAFFKIEE